MFVQKSGYHVFDSGIEYQVFGQTGISFRCQSLNIGDVCTAHLPKGAVLVEQWEIC